MIDKEKKADELYDLLKKLCKALLAEDKEGVQATVLKSLWLLHDIDGTFDFDKGFFNRP